MSFFFLAVSYIPLPFPALVSACVEISHCLCFSPSFLHVLSLLYIFHTFCWIISSFIPVKESVVYFFSPPNLCNIPPPLIFGYILEYLTKQKSVKYCDWKLTFSVQQSLKSSSIKSFEPGLNKENVRVSVFFHYITASRNEEAISCGKGCG